MSLETFDDLNRARRAGGRLAKLQLINVGHHMVGLTVAAVIVTLWD